MAPRAGGAARPWVLSAAAPPAAAGDAGGAVGSFVRWHVNSTGLVVMREEVPSDVAEEWFQAPSSEEGAWNHSSLNPRVTSPFPHGCAPPALGARRPRGAS